MKFLGTAEMTTARSLGIRAFLQHHRENPVLDSRSLWPNTLLVGRHHSMAYSRKRSYRPETFRPVTRHKGWHIKRKSAMLAKLGIGPRCIFPSIWSRSLWCCARLAAKDGLDIFNCWERFRLIHLQLDDRHINRMRTLYVIRRCRSAIIRMKKAN
jgi:hypothetical protein